MAKTTERTPSNERSNKAARAAARRAGERRARRTRSIALWGIGGLLAASLIGLVSLGGGRGGRASAPLDPALIALAEANAGSPVQVYEGNAHIVYHAIAPLPTAAAPSDDARPTLVWFSGTWCHFCEQMEPFANDVASRFHERARFVEKSVDHDRGAAARYGVRGTPTFVLVDGAGNELGWFFFQGDEGAFARAIESALASVGA